MQLWKKIQDLVITKAIKIGQEAALTFTSPLGVETTFKPFVKTLTAASTISETDNGTTFILNAAAGFATTLPPVKAGLKFKFIVGAAFATTDMTIVSNGSSNVIVGAVLTPNVNAASAADSETSGGDTISFVSTLESIGDSVEVFCDGSKWYATAVAVAYNAVTITTAS